MATFLFTGKSSTLSADYNPPIYLEEDVDYEIALISFDSFYSIPNISRNNNRFKWWGENGGENIAELPEGSYEITNIFNAIQDEISRTDNTASISFELDHISSMVKITSNRNISFNIENSIGSVIGFNNRTVDANITTTGDSTVSIMKVNAICIDCNIAGSSYLNGKPCHYIHSFYPQVAPQYKIVESVVEPIYYPVVVKAITNITVKIVDQDGELLNFRDDIRTVRLHLRKVDS
jgi:hypothetical protein